MAEESSTPWLDKQRKIASRCEKELGRPPRAGYAYRVYGGVCVEEKLLPGGTTGSDQMKAAARAYRVDENGKRDLSAFEEIAKVEVEAAGAEIDSAGLMLQQLSPPKIDHNASLRYPKNPPINQNSDYVAFNFYKYAPPFKGQKTGFDSGYNEGKLVSQTSYDYNQASDYQAASDEYQTI